MSAEEIAHVVGESGTLKAALEELCALGLLSYSSSTRTYTVSDFTEEVGAESLALAALRQQRYRDRKGQLAIDAATKDDEREQPPSLFPLAPKKPRQSRLDTRTEAQQIADLVIVEMRATIEPKLIGESWRRWCRVNRPILVDMAATGMGAPDIVEAHARESDASGELIRSMSLLQRRLNGHSSPWKRNGSSELSAEQSKLTEYFERDLAEKKEAREARRANKS